MGCRKGCAVNKKRLKKERLMRFGAKGSQVTLKPAPPRTVKRGGLRLVPPVG